MSDDVRSRLRGSAERVLASQPVRFAYLFGSHASGMARPDSDVDVAVRLDAGVPPDRYLDLSLVLARELAGATRLGGLEVVVLNGATLPFRARIIADGVVIYSVDEPARVEFESRTFREFGDFEIVFRGMDRELLEHIAMGRR